MNPAMGAGSGRARTRQVMSDCCDRGEQKTVWPSLLKESLDDKHLGHGVEPQKTFGMNGIPLLQHSSGRMSEGSGVSMKRAN